jgi:hypothetical protein
VNFAPVKTLEELDSLDHAEMIEGYAAAERGDPEPGPNRGKAYWHGWCNRMRDFGELPIDPEHLALVRAWVARESSVSPALN